MRINKIRKSRAVTQYDNRKASRKKYSAENEIKLTVLATYDFNVNDKVRLASRITAEYNLPIGTVNAMITRVLRTNNITMLL